MNGRRAQPDRRRSRRACAGSKRGAKPQAKITPPLYADRSKARLPHAAKDILVASLPFALRAHCRTAQVRRLRRRSATASVSASDSGASPSDRQGQASLCPVLRSLDGPHPGLADGQRFRKSEPRLKDGKDGGGSRPAAQPTNLRVIGAMGRSPVVEIAPPIASQPSTA